jgi:hypothetical protein
MQRDRGCRFRLDLWFVVLFPALVAAPNHPLFFVRNWFVVLICSDLTPLPLLLPLHLISYILLHP